MSTWHYIAVSFLSIASLAIPVCTAEEQNQTLSWPDGTRYVGGTKDGKRHGRGTIYWQDGTRYIGEFRADLRQGEGFMILPDGTTYRGLFDNDNLTLDHDPTSRIDTEAATAAATVETDIETETESESESESESETETDHAANQDATVDSVTQRTIIDILDLWAAAWMSKDVVQYLALYSTDFQPSNNQSRPIWSLNRKDRILSASYIQIDIGYEAFTSPSPGIIDVAITQSYRSNTYKEVSNKLIRVQEESEGWRILKERDR